MEPVFHWSSMIKSCLQCVPMYVHSYSVIACRWVCPKPASYCVTGPDWSFHDLLILFWAKKLYPTYSDITSWVNAHHIWSLISVRMSCAPKYRDSGLVRRWYDLQSMKNSSAPCCDTIIEHTSQQFLWTQPAFQSNTRSSTLWVVCAREKQDHHQKPPPQLAERQSSASSTEQTSERTISASAGGSQGTPSWWWILKLLFLWDSCAPTNRILCERENGAAFAKPNKWIAITGF